jgi:hypothetical protein
VGSLTSSKINEMLNDELLFLKLPQKIIDDKINLKNLLKFGRNNLLEQFLTKEQIMFSGPFSDKNKRIVKKAIEMELSPLAYYSLILYRGSHFERDFPPYVLSYGKSLFGGVINDSGTTAFYYMNGESLDEHLGVMKPNEGFVLYIPYEDIKNSYFPFHVPLSSIYQEWSGEGSPYHPHLKTNDYEILRVFKKDNNDLYEQIKFNGSLNDLKREFIKYHNRKKSTILE